MALDVGLHAGPDRGRRNLFLALDMALDVDLDPEIGFQRALEALEVPLLVDRVLRHVLLADALDHVAADAGQGL